MTNLIFKQHHSKLDQSVNFEHRFEDHEGMLEARYVRRVDEYFIVYLSSQTGCKQACRMCWLTATGQTTYENTTVEQYLQQAREVLDYYATLGVPAERVHFNFMARGEPLDNPIFIKNADTILKGLADLAAQHGLKHKFLISTIFPTSLGKIKLTDIFKDPTVYPEIYYSIYSMVADFRRRWLPKATHPDSALLNLVDWQEETGKVPKIHYAFIEGENDTVSTVGEIIDRVEHLELKVNWNIVRYNAPNDKSKEPEETVVESLYKYICQRLPESKVKMIPRVGTDVMASCGTFLK